MQNASLFNKESTRTLERIPILQTVTGHNITVYGNAGLKNTFGHSEIKTNVLVVDIMD